MTLFTTSIVIEVLAIGANFHHSSRNHPPTPVIGKRIKRIWKGGKFDDFGKVVKFYTSHRHTGVNVRFYGVRTMFGGKGGIRLDIGGIYFEEDLLIQMLTGTFKTISTLVGLVSVLIHIGAHLYTDYTGGEVRKITLILRSQFFFLERMGPARWGHPDGCLRSQNIK